MHSDIKKINLRRGRCHKHAYKSNIFVPLITLNLLNPGILTKMIKNLRGNLRNISEKKYLHVKFLQWTVKIAIFYFSHYKSIENSYHRKQKSDEQ